MNESQRHDEPQTFLSHRLVDGQDEHDTPHMGHSMLLESRVGAVRSASGPYTPHALNGAYLRTLLLDNDKIFLLAVELTRSSVTQFELDTSTVESEDFRQSKSARKRGHAVLVAVVLLQIVSAHEWSSLCSISSAVEEAAR